MANTIDIKATLNKLSIQDKISLLGGSDLWHFAEVPNAGVPRLRVSDGPNGVRGTRFFNGTPSSCYPCATGLGSTFDLKLIHKIGVALAEECIAKSAHCHLAPTVNTQRSPLGGRGFESFSEDPFLNGMIGAAYVNGVQSKGVASTPKHFVCNDQEFERFSTDSVVADRALREIYLEPFRLICKHSSPLAFMTAYNRVNSIHASESNFLLDQVLRKEWGWKGLIMSDWTGVYTTAESIKAGLDVEMPGPPVMRNKAAVSRALDGGKLTVADIDTRVLEVLRLIEHAQKSGIPFNGPEETLDTPALRTLLRSAAADSIVLLKNTKNLLPITAESKIKKITLIGSNARIAVPSGGGSASVNATYTISPLLGIQDAAKKIGAEVEFSMGAAAYRYAPLLDGLTKTKSGEAGVLLEFWKDAPIEDFYGDVESKLSKPDHSTTTNTTVALMLDGLPAEIVGRAPYIRFICEFIPDISGLWAFGIVTAGFSKLYMDGKLLIDNTPPNYKQGQAFFGIGSEEARALTKSLQAGQSYTLELRSHVTEEVSSATPFPVFGAIRVGALPAVSDKDAIAAAVEKAEAADLAIVVVGTNPDWEAESFDRKDIKLPGASDDLVEAVLKANPKTIVVVQTGMPASMPWADDASVILQAFFGGNEVGNGMADVIFGAVNPSAKLPLTFPQRLQDNPSFKSFGETSETPGKSLYNEGIYVGYRHYEKSDIAPLFPFGYGLSYTTFEYSGLSVSPVKETGEFSVSFKIKNTGSSDGREIAQVYVSDPVAKLARPIKELAGFQKVTLGSGKEVDVTISFEKKALSYWDPSIDSWVAEAGDFDILVCASSADIRLMGKTNLAETIRWKGL